MDNIEKMYFLFIDSYLLYSIEVHGNSYGTYVTKLSVLNNKLFHILQNKPFDYNCSLLCWEHIVNASVLHL